MKADLPLGHINLLKLIFNLFCRSIIQRGGERGRGGGGGNQGLCSDVYEPFFQTCCIVCIVVYILIPNSVIWYLIQENVSIKTPKALYSFSHKDQQVKLKNEATVNNERTERRNENSAKKRERRA